MIFQTVAHPPVFDDGGTAVHDISNAELADGPDLDMYICYVYTSRDKDCKRGVTGNPLSNQQVL